MLIKKSFLLFLFSTILILQLFSTSKNKQLFLRTEKDCKAYSKPDINSKIIKNLDNLFIFDFEKILMKKTNKNNSIEWIKILFDDGQKGWCQNNKIQLIDDPEEQLFLQKINKYSGKYTNEILSEAVEKGFTHTVEVISKKIKDINERSLYGENYHWPAIVYAHIYNRVNIKKILIENGADVKYIHTYQLFSAINNNETSKINELIELGADINYFVVVKEEDKRFYRRNMFMIPIMKNNIEMVKELSKYDIDFNKVYNEGDTALHLACKYNCTDIAKFLVKNGAKINVLNRSNMFSPLVYIIINENIHLAKEFIKSGADVNLIDKLDSPYKLNTSPLIQAVEKENFELVKLLIESGANINHKETYGRSIPLQSALSIALKKNSRKIAEYLLENRANPNIEFQMCPWPPILFYAAFMNYTKIVELMIINRVDLNIKFESPDDSGKHTLLYYLDNSDNYRIFFTNVEEMKQVDYTEMIQLLKNAGAIY